MNVAENNAYKRDEINRRIRLKTAILASTVKKARNNRQYTAVVRKGKEKD